MKELFNTVIAAGLISVSTVCAASSYQGTVTNIFAHSDKVYVRVANGHYDNKSACVSTDNSIEVWLDPNAEFGKALLSLALVAKTSDKLVWLATDDICISGPRGIAVAKLVALDLKS